MKEQTFSENHNHGGRCGLYSCPEVSTFTDTLLAELEERSAVLRGGGSGNSSKEPHNYTAYHSAGRDIADIGAVVLADWFDSKGTTAGLRSIAQRLCNALMTLECGIGLCPDRTQWKPPMRTMRMLAGFSEKN